MDDPSASAAIDGPAAIPVGGGTTADARAVEAAIHALGLSGTVSYRRIAAGITNLNWLVFADDQTLFVKLFGAGTASFIDRDSATEASRIAGELGVGPRLIAYLPDVGAEVFEYLHDYRTITAEEMLAPAPRAALMTAYRRMHQSGKISLTRTGFDQLDARVAQAREIDAPLPDDLEALLERCARARAAIEAAGMPLTVCHNDSYAANFMIGPDGDLRVIDWEYAANNDSAWDLAMIALAHGDAAGITAMVRDYDGAATPETVARVLLYGPVVLTSWGLWAALQTKLSTIAFDYAGYSAMLFGFGRAKFADPSWEAALCQL